MACFQKRIFKNRGVVDLTRERRLRRGMPGRLNIESSLEFWGDLDNAQIYVYSRMA